MKGQSFQPFAFFRGFSKANPDLCPSLHTALNHQPGNCIIPNMHLWPFQVRFYPPTYSLSSVTKLWACHNLTRGTEQNVYGSLASALESGHPHGWCCWNFLDANYPTAKFPFLRHRPIQLRFSDGIFWKLLSWVYWFWLP